MRDEKFENKSEDSLNELTNSNTTSAIIHETVLIETCSAAKSFIISSFLGFWSDSMTIIIWILYVRSIVPTNFTNSDSTLLISILSASQQISQIIGILISSYLSDRYGFDTLSVITSILLCIAFGCKAFVTNLLLFIFGFMLQGFLRDDIEIFTLGFLGKMLPYKTAVIYTSYYYSITTIPWMIAVPLSGVIVSITPKYYDNPYSFTYITAFGFVAIRCIYILIAIKGKQNVLIRKQLQFIAYYKELDQHCLIQHEQLDDELEMDEINKDRFPLCIDEMNKQIRNIELDSDDESTCFISLFSSNELKNKSKWYWIELFSNITQFAIISSDAFVVWVFYPMYAKDIMNVDIFISSSQLGVCTVCHLLVMWLIPEFIANKFKKLKSKYLLLIPAYIILILLFFIFSFFSNINIFWITMTIYGFVEAFIWIVTEILVLELQPKKDSGKINGIKTVARYSVGAILYFCIAYSWDVSINVVWFWYLQIFFVTIALCLNCVVLILR
eukprot:402485_1